MEEKKKQTAIEEDSVSLPTTDERHPFSDDPNVRRLQNAFGEALGDLPLPEETQQEWTAFIERQERKKRKLYLRIWMSGGAAAVIALLLLLWSPWQSTDGNLSDIEIFAALDAPEQITTTEANGRITVSTPPTTITSLTLADGTRVLLSANSRLDYPKEFISPAERTVYLTGEARFEVTKDAHRPFIVSAGKMQTQVLGTVFDVNAYPGNTPAVTLYEGHVKVSQVNSSLKKELLPGQSATLTANGKIHLSKATRTEKEGWASNEFYFDNTTLLQVLQQIGTWYNISIICHSAKLLDKRIHFRYPRNVPPEELLTALNDLGIAHFEMKHERIVVNTPHT